MSVDWEGGRVSTEVSLIFISLFEWYWKRQPYKMVKYTQQLTDELFECAWPFCGIGV